jgi:tetratricopeptide (TPR) repeat protein
MRAIDWAERSENFSASLRAHADLAEIDLWHGDELAKATAVERVRNALARDYGSLQLDEERAALAYQLGSALIVSGDRAGAQEVILNGLQLAPGDYWRMKLANALASAHYYLGNFREAFAWLDEGWRCAERGGIDAFKARILANRAGLFYGLGRFREAVETHDLSAQWGRRTGNTAEFILARAGASINLTLLGRYDEALDLARKAYEGARKIASAHEGAKALELQALASYYIGDYDGAAHLVDLATHETEGLGFDDVTPRLAWLKARLCTVRGDYDSAEGALRNAEEVLVRTKDWEDLPGVQIEMQVVLFRKGAQGSSLNEVKRLALDAERNGARVVFLYGALAVAEIVMANRAYDGENREFLLDSLGRAEESGAAEFSWRLSQALGEIASDRSETREASARYSHAVRRFREIADHLTPAHRRLYLKTAHASRLLQRAAEINKAT